MKLNKVIPQSLISLILGVMMGLPFLIIYILIFGKNDDYFILYYILIAILLIHFSKQIGASINQLTEDF